MKNFRPIALCNTMAKVITKALAMRLKNVLPTIISKTQSAFLFNRLITDNVLLSYELHHFIKNKKIGKDGFMSIKLDMMKAYDMIEWSFLKAMMVQLNFSYKWIKLIMDYLTSVSYSILINGTQSGFFQPGRGLRQGGPLSPYLFIICIEGLISLFNASCALGELQGINMGDNTATFSHLVFADDTFYWFCPNVSEDLKVAIIGILGMPEVTTHGKYLGLPTSLGTSKKDFYSSLITRVKVKVECWKPRLLSKAGKEIFIKSVLQVIPNYPMDVSCCLYMCATISFLSSQTIGGDPQSKRN
ncbi:hypothetical protein LIER_08089 [Lithospermum erythrorhizon]|uniref:Reverse transcriptase domain-containing protein n=1 Tax=Lithospermum erythrorhizon TaxID=34254 RepID=A0AAV3PBA2_LITER